MAGKYGYHVYGIDGDGTLLVDVNRGAKNTHHQLSAASAARVAANCFSKIPGGQATAEATVTIVELTESQRSEVKDQCVLGKVRKQDGTFEDAATWKARIKIDNPNFDADLPGA